MASGSWYPALVLERTAVLVVVASLAVSCGTSSPAAVEALDDAGVSDPSTGDPADAGADAIPSSDVVPAADYCEAVVEPFCAFYLRCGRMLADDLDECRAVFLETCNARYEPRYVDLEQTRLLSLSRAGIDACAAHLDGVACREQISDLGGPCGAMWVGAAPAGAPCGIDVESLVCAPGTTCVLGLDFCGSCAPAAPRGGACAQGGPRCASDDACIEGRCIARALPGAACSDVKPCITGSACTAGTCVAPSVVGEGEACDAKRRCPYRASCASGKCVRGSLLGEPCTGDRVCVSGRCVSGKCADLRADGDACGTNPECSSAQCTSGTCEPLPTACLSR